VAELAAEVPGRQSNRCSPTDGATKGFCNEPGVRGKLSLIGIVVPSESSPIVRTRVLETHNGGSRRLRGLCPGVCTSNAADGGLACATSICRSRKEIGTHRRGSALVWFGAWAKIPYGKISIDSSSLSGGV